ncbi:MAG: precorrin-6A reductase [Armatimonadetes bacterium]|nr:precorrin-6A reductase [Armatimonadota bacterium]
MILLLGGTSETAPLAEALAGAGHPVLISTATDIELDVGTHPAIRRRCGCLDREGLVELIRGTGVRAIVDATHPYASAIRAMAREVASSERLPYLTWIRPGTADTEATFAADHEEAARLACAPGLPVLLTTGSRVLLPYARQAREKGIVLVARVLSHPDSLSACRAAGVDHVVTGRGPFSVEENRSLIRRFGIGVLVTKDSGVAGGVPEKLEAAREEGCRVVVVGRPSDTAAGSFASYEELVEAVGLRA